MTQKQTQAGHIGMGSEMALYMSQLSHPSLAKSSKSELVRVLNHLSYLYSIGEISEKAFEILVKHVCQVFVEAEIERRLSKYLEQKLFKLMDRLTSDEAMMKLLGVSANNG